MIVLDASALIEVLLNLPLATSIRARLSHAGEIHAPQLSVVETLQVLRRRAHAGLVDVSSAATAVDLLGDLDLHLHDHLLLAHRVWQLRDDVTAYDAPYAALAEALDAPLLTPTRDSPPAAPGIEATVALVERD